jgi:hypothetical protein
MVAPNPNPQPIEAAPVSARYYSINEAMPLLRDLGLACHPSIIRQASRQRLGFIATGERGVQRRYLLEDLVAFIRSFRRSTEARRINEKKQLARQRTANLSLNPDLARRRRSGKAHA